MEDITDLVRDIKSKRQLAKLDRERQALKVMIDHYEAIARNTCNAGLSAHYAIEHILGIK